MRFRIEHAFWAVLATLICTAIFFTSGIITFKRSLTDTDIQFPSGQKVTVTNIIDGDDIAVRTGDRQFRVRLLGIASFDPTLNDPQVRGAAEATTAYLRKMLLNNEIELVFDTFMRDGNGRVMSFVHRNSIDIGEDMVANGLTLVYTKYPFSRVKRYLSAERLARDERAGIWGNPVLHRRSLELKKVWERQ